MSILRFEGARLQLPKQLNNPAKRWAKLYPACGAEFKIPVSIHRVEKLCSQNIEQMRLVSALGGDELLVIAG
jgi:hypothetical protein